ncbi:TPA: hypothetical protein N2D99_002052 [Clostridium botulinum]|nr:hypothetical protein [Clostridium botulinum]
MNNLTNNEKEIILQAIDLLIEDTEYAVNHSIGGLQEYRNKKLQVSKN